MSQSGTLSVGGGPGEVFSVTGTANQILATPTTGNVVVSLTNGISLGSYQASTPPTGGMLIPGQVSIGSSTPDARAFLEIDNNGPYIFTTFTTGTVTTQSCITHFDNTICSPTISSGNIISFDSNIRASVPAGITASLATCFYGAIEVTGNLGTITNAYNYFAAPFIGPIGGVVTNAYGGYFSNPGLGSNQIPLYADGAAIGFPGVVPPISGLVVAGQALYGSGILDPSAAVQISSTTQGFLPPSMTTTQKNAIAFPASGLEVYDSTLNNLSFFNGTVWSGNSSVNIQVFTTSGTYTPSIGLSFAVIRLCAGGGGGGGSPDLSASVNFVGPASGGGSGGYSEGIFNAATIGASQAITIGTGGAGGDDTGSTGSDGGTSSVGALMSCTGGLGGLGSGSGSASDSIVNLPSGGDGGTASGGYINVTGQDGSGAVGMTVTTLSIATPSVLYAEGGFGGSGSLGAGGTKINASSPGGTGLAGFPGTGFGSGGGGACTVYDPTGSGAAGGNGADGIAIIIEYILY